jgi:Cyclin, N-terminal domain/Cyclin, C-terminal domain
MDCPKHIFSMTSIMKDAIATIAAMCHQESVGYGKSDYLNASTAEPGCPPLDVDADCRRKMAAWCYQVCDFCKFRRETAEIAMISLDRFLQSPTGMPALFDRSLFQLSAMTCLYTAVKIHEPEAMDPNLVSSLSRGTYSPQDVEEMERVILQGVNWRVNPPTTLSFVRQFFNLIPAEAMTVATRNAVYDVTKFQTELAVSDYDFVAVPSSVMAYCSFVNALESLEVQILDRKVIQYIASIVQQALGMQNCCADHVVLQVQNVLFQAVLQHHVSKPAASSKKQPAPQQKVNRTITPRSVLQQLS